MSEQEKAAMGYSVEFIGPDRLYAIEVQLQDLQWIPVTIGPGIRITAPDVSAADNLITQLRQAHIAQARKMPPIRKRLLTKEETAEIRKHYNRHGYRGELGGPDPRSQKAPKPGETSYTG